MRRTVRNIAAVFATVAMVVTVAVTAVQPARADASGFILNSTRFGPNATVMIELGALTRACDFIIVRFIIR